MQFILMLLLHESHFLMLQQKSIHQYLIWKAQSRKTPILIGTTQLSTVLGTMYLEQKTEVCMIQVDLELQGTHEPLKSVYKKSCVVCAHIFLGKGPMTSISFSRGPHSTLENSNLLRISSTGSWDLRESTFTHLRVRFRGKGVGKKTSESSSQGLGREQLQSVIYLVSLVTCSGIGRETGIKC